MKIVYQNVISLLFFVAYNYLSLAEDQPIELDVAAFFHKENSHSQIAFETAIDNFNLMFSDIKFNRKAIVVPEDESFETSNYLCNLIENNNLGGVVCPPSSRVSPVIESACINLEIPAMQLDWRSDSLREDGVLVNFYPYPKLLFQGIGVVVKNLQWRSFVIFYEDTESLIRLQDVLKFQDYSETNKANSVIVIQLGPGPDYRSALKQIQNKSEHRILMDCKTENIVTILKQAKDLRLLEKQYNYLLTALDAHTVNLDVLDTAANITTIRIINPGGDFFENALSRWRQHSRGSQVDLDSYAIETETAIMYDAINTYLKAVRDLHAKNAGIQPTTLSCHDDIKPWENGLLISSFMKSRSFESEDLYSITGPMSFDSMGRRINFTLYVVEGNREEVIATWNPTASGKNSHLNFLKSEEDRNKELERKWSQGGLVVASIIGPPYLMERKPPEGEPAYEGNKRYEGFSMDLMLELGKKLHVSFTFEILENGKRGAYDKNTKSWNGLVGEILARRADLAICDLTITPERREAVDFSTPFMRLGISILHKTEEAEDANMYAFMNPLSLDLWIYTATLYLAVTVVFFFITRLSPPDWENPHPCDPEPEELENIWDMKNCLWLTLGSIMNQGCDILPKGMASRMAAAMWWFYAIIVTNSYMANLAAFLTNERSQNSINSADDLAKQTKVKYGTMKDGSTEAFFRESNYSVYQRMWTNMLQSKPSVFESSNEAGVARVQNTKNRNYAFLMESPTLEYQISTKCDLIQVGNWLDSKSYGIAMPLDYPHRSRINEKLLDLQEDGTINALKEKWWKEKRTEPLCKPKESDGGGSSNKLALQNVGGVFVVLGVGIALSYVVAFFEFLWNVRNVSVEEHMTYKEALICELKFAVNVMVTKKKVKRTDDGSSSSSQSSRSGGIARSILQGTGSFLRLDVLSKEETPGSSRHSSRPLD